MKRGGQSWNRSLNHKRGVSTTVSCRKCGRMYKMDWARNNHEKLCGENGS